MAKKNGNGKDEPLEKQLWKSADKLRKNIDAAEYKHVVLGLIFLKYISDAFEELYYKLQKVKANTKVPILKIKTNTKQKMYSLFRHRHVGVFFWQMLSKQP